MTEQKKARLEARISEKQKQILQEAATVSGQSLTDFLISSALENARSIIEQDRVLKLTTRDCEKFVSALLKDADPGEELKQAVRDSADFLNR